MYLSIYIFCISVKAKVIPLPPKKPKVDVVPKKKEVVNNKPKQPIQINFAEMAEWPKIRLHRVSDAEVTKWTAKKANRTMSVNSRDSSKHGKNKSKSTVTVDTSDSSDSDTTKRAKNKSKAVFSVDSSSDSDSVKSVKKSKTSIRYVDVFIDQSIFKILLIPEIRR